MAVTDLEPVDVARARTDPWQGDRPETPLGLLAFMATVLMLFTAFTAAYLIRRTGDDWAPIELPRTLWGSTAVLFLSSVAIEGARRRGGRWVTGTVLLGLAFLVLQLGAWRQMAAAGYFLSNSSHAAFVYLLTALHGLHLGGGIVALVLCWRGLLAVRPAATYWHFMGAIWLYVYLVLALL